MNTCTLLNDFIETKECSYKGERYLVRDNGAVFRFPKEDGKHRKLDGEWSFGKKNEKTGYMTIGGHRVHIIVATAFYGSRDTKEYVVDHIDTNRCNNRPENLRWFTRLENALSNPATRKKIEFLCGGDIRRFINNPSCLKDLTGTNQDVMWMRTASSEEAKAAYQRIIMEWSQKPNMAFPDSSSQKGKMGEWIYSSLGKGEATGKSILMEEERKLESEPADGSAVANDNLSDSLTPTAKQRNWTTPTEFPLCPLEGSERPLAVYCDNLKEQACVSKNKNAAYFVDEYALCGDKLVIRTHTFDNLKNYAITYVTFEDGKYIHEGKTFFEELGAKKAFVLAKGEEWDGSDGVDDYC